MFKTMKALALCTALAAATPAFADAVTYAGTLGKSRIVVEFTGDPAAAGAEVPLAGRYFYPAQGVDIPLQPDTARGGALVLSEEKPCTAKICKDPPDGQAAKPPIGARWTLSATASGLEGEWKAVGGGTALPLKLQRVGSRPTPGDFDPTPQGLVDLTDQRIWSGTLAPITREATPYDFLKMQEPLTASPDTVRGDVAFRYVVDPRTRFRYPRIARLPEVADIAAAPANGYLEERHWLLNVGALGCMAEQYQGLGWNELVAPAAGTLAGYEDQTIDVSYLSPRLMSWTESGSLFCGGAHPENFTNSYTIDVAKGAPFDMSRIFKGWVARPSDDPDGAPAELDTARAAPPGEFVWGPDAELAAFVVANRPKPAAGEDEECFGNDLVAQNLAIRFKEGDRVVFAVEGLPHVISACEGDLFDRPITELRALLTPEAAAYFLVLKP